MDLLQITMFFAALIGGGMYMIYVMNIIKDNNEYNKTITLVLMVIALVCVLVSILFLR